MASDSDLGFSVSLGYIGKLRFKVVGLGSVPGMPQLPVMLLMHKHQNII